MSYSKMDTTTNAIVVGGGPAGLTAAARLAEQGIQTTLLEAAATLGGRASTERRAGFDLNRGPHALYEGGAGIRELRALGIHPPRWNPTSHRSVFIRDNRPSRLPSGAGGLSRWLLGVRRWRPETLAELSVAEWLRRDLRSENARASAAALVRVTTYVADHESLSADVAAAQLQIGLFPGVRYLKGGWQPMVDAIADRARRHGATIRTRAAVRGLHREGGRWTATLDDETLTADVIVLAAGEPATFAKLLGELAPTAPGPAAEVSSLDLGLASLPRRGRRFALGIDQPTYLSRHSAPDHRGGQLLTVASYDRRPQEYLEAVADSVQPGWRDRAMLTRFLPRMVAVAAIATPARGGLAGRPTVDQGEGLFLAGDWLGSEGWLVDAAIASGASAAAAATAMATAGAPTRERAPA